MITIKKYVMKKFALLILAFVAMTAHAQVDLSAIFDWNNPTQLNPSITPSTVNGGSANAMNKTFSQGLIQISFQYEYGTGGDAYIETQVNAYTGETKYALIITKGGEMVVTATGGATLNSITWDEYSDPYDLLLKAGQPGTLDTHSWQAGSEAVSSVTRTARSAPSQFARALSVESPPLLSSRQTAHRNDRIRFLVLFMGALPPIRSGGLVFQSVKAGARFRASYLLMVQVSGAGQSP